MRDIWRHQNTFYGSPCYTLPVSLRVSVEWYRQAYKKRWGKEPVEDSKVVSPKASKLHNIKVQVGDIIFASKWEAQVYADLTWQYKAGLITEPLLQVRFALGVHYGRETYYVCDFVYVDLKTKELIVADAKGVCTGTYKQKRRMMECVYGIKITEFYRRRQ